MFGNLVHLQRVSRHFVPGWTSRRNYNFSSPGARSRAINLRRRARRARGIFLAGLRSRLGVELIYHSLGEKKKERKKREIQPGSGRTT